MGEKSSCGYYDSVGATFLQDSYDMYVGNAKTVRIKLTNGTFGDLYGRISSYVFGSGVFIGDIGEI